jgi:outer membrane protein assembly factor BamE (lipoprotein component of BamABCDE complex)
MNTRFKYIILTVTCYFLAGCSGVSITEWHFPYMMEVQQGNYINTEQYSQLKIGQTKAQVSYIIGKPLTQFLFDQNQWDFIYQDYKSNQLKKSYNVSIIFDKNGTVTNFYKSGQVFDK